MSVSIQVPADALDKIPDDVKKRILITATDIAFSTNRKGIKDFLISTLSKYYLLEQEFKSLIEVIEIKQEKSNG